MKLERKASQNQSESNAKLCNEPPIKSLALNAAITCRAKFMSNEALPLWSIGCRVLAYIVLSIDGISRNRQVTYSEIKEMWETFFVDYRMCSITVNR